jgi:8-oxo-dGTP diphosphatase
MKLATLCYVRRSARTLMIHRVKKANDIHEGKWNGLGGKLEPGESPEECAVREILEESGLRAISMRLKGFLTFPLFARNEDWYAFVFVVDEFDGELIDSPEGDLEWIDDEKLLTLNLWQGDRIFLPLLDQPGLFSAKIVYRESRLVSHALVIYPP